MILWRTMLIMMSAAGSGVDENARLKKGGGSATSRAFAGSSQRYQAEDGDEELHVRLVQLAREKRRFGYRPLHVLLRGSGERVTHKRVYRALPGRRDRASEEVQTRCAHMAGARDLDKSEPGVGTGLRTRCGGPRRSSPGTRCGRGLHAAFRAW